MLLRNQQFLSHRLNATLADGCGSRQTFRKCVLRFWHLSNRPRAENTLVYLINLDKIPTRWNREIFSGSRDLFRLIRECTKADQGISNAPRQRSKPSPEGGRLRAGDPKGHPSPGWSSSRLFV